jgi:uncharacterized protein (UPF0548 family)
VWSLRRPRDAELAAVLAGVAARAVTYSPIGMSRPGANASGFHLEEHRAELALDFATARERLATFATHALPYLFVYPRDARVVVRRDVVVCARVGAVWSINPCRVVLVEDTPDRFAYAYGTLPGHVESGEEWFSVEKVGSRVVAETRAYARMADVFARLLTPIARRVQRRVKVDYLRALAG